MKKSWTRLEKLFRKQFFSGFVETTVLTIWIMTQWVTDELKEKFSLNRFNLLALDTFQIMGTIVAGGVVMIRGIRLLFRVYYSALTRIRRDKLRYKRKKYENHKHK